MAADSASGEDPPSVEPADAPSVVEYFARGAEPPQPLQTPAAHADTPTILSGMPLPPPSTPSNPASPDMRAAQRSAAMDAARWPDADAASWRTDRVERRGASGALAALAVALAALALVVAACGTLGRLGAVSVLIQSAVPPAFTDPATQAAPSTATRGGTSTSGGASSSPQPGARSTPAPAPGATANATSTAGPTPVGTPVPGPTGTPTATAPPSPTGTPIPPDGPPMLVVDPRSISVPLTQCLAAQASTSFTVKNSGGGTLDWTATTAAGYAISPASGTLRAGEQASVTVSSISKSGQIAVTAPGVAGSPRTVTITCTL
ncbi:MAG TPA: hypothetical protein VLJ14_06800 [Ktedonobacterales bacterium]|nr:hypothetical protein [Ktedonobacterales bacterium]